MQGCYHTFPEVLLRCIFFASSSWRPATPRWFGGYCQGKKNLFQAHKLPLDHHSLHFVYFRYVSTCKLIDSWLYSFKKKIFTVNIFAPSLVVTDMKREAWNCWVDIVLNTNKNDNFHKREDQPVKWSNKWTLMQFIININ